jgi:hypothetical protein
MAVAQLRWGPPAAVHPSELGGSRASVPAQELFLTRCPEVAG